MTSGGDGPGLGGTTLILWRHGQTDWNGSARVQGQTDVDLNDVGREQAAAAAGILARLRPDALVASDLRRAADTAAALSALTGLPVRHDARLRERHFGQWQGLLLSEIAERYPREYARWRAGEVDPGFGVENTLDLTKRVGEALLEVAESTPGGTVVVATHGGAARQGCGALVGWDGEVLRGLGPLANCRWAVLRYDGSRGWRLRGYNLAA